MFFGYVRHYVKNSYCKCNEFLTVSDTYFGHKIFITVMKGFRGNDFYEKIWRDLCLFFVIYNYTFYEKIWDVIIIPSFCSFLFRCGFRGLRLVL